MRIQEYSCPEVTVTIIQWDGMYGTWFAMIIILQLCYSQNCKKNNYHLNEHVATHGHNEHFNFLFINMAIHFVQIDNISNKRTIASRMKSLLIKNQTSKLSNCLALKSYIHHKKINLHLHLMNFNRNSYLMHPVHNEYSM